MPKSPRGLLAALLAVLATITLTVVITDDAGDQPRRTITVQVDGRDRDRQPDDELVVPAPAVDAATDAIERTGHDGLRDETPPGVPDDQVDAAREQQERLANSDQLPIVTPFAAPSQRGCESRFLPTNYSSRRGVAPRLFVVHWSGGPNRPGWEDVAGLTAYGSRSNAGVSWTYNVDREGHCHYNVRESDKAWTQAGFNPVSISVEIINLGGNDTPLLAAGGLKTLGTIISDSTGRWDIPLRIGAVSGCTVTRSGIVSHVMLGPCGGGHPDVGGRTLSAQTATLQPILDAAKKARAQSTPTVTSVDKITCRKLNWWRANGRPHGLAERRAVRRRKALDSRNVKCTPRGPVKVS